MDNDFCNSVLPIPQYGPTCWFNAILMCILKSQNSRKLLIDKFKINSKSSKYLKIIYGLLMKSYILNSKLYHYYKKLFKEKINTDLNPDYIFITIIFLR